MNQSNNVILFSIALIGFAVGMVGRVWQMSSSLSEMRHSLEKSDLRLENLALLHEAAFNGFKEQIKHSTDRFRAEIVDLNRRLEDVEGYLTKSTEFTRRR